jgi:hypothetical protein
MILALNRSGAGHCGIVTKVRGGFIHTIEANTSFQHLNDGTADREGDGIYEKSRNHAKLKIAKSGLRLLGFLRPPPCR